MSEMLKRARKRVKDDLAYVIPLRYDTDVDDPVEWFLRIMAEVNTITEAMMIYHDAKTPFVLRHAHANLRDSASLTAALLTAWVAQIEQWMVDNPPPPRET